MSKILFDFLVLIGLITFVHALDVPVKVGGPAGENFFYPQTVLATPGDNIIFNWVSGKHSIIESDAKASCAKSLKADFFTSGDVFTAPHQLRVPVSKAGIRWFYCGVSGHCESGMYGTIIVETDNTSSPSISSSSTSSSTNSTGSLNTAGTIAGLLVTGSFSAIGIYFLFKKGSRNNNKAHNHGHHGQEAIDIDNNNNYDIVQVVKQNMNNSNPGQVLESESQINNDQAIPAASTNDKVRNHGQEAIPISENNNST